MNFYTENFDALKRYESTEVDSRTWLHVPSGTHCPQASGEEKTNLLRRTAWRYKMNCCCLSMEKSINRIKMVYNWLTFMHIHTVKSTVRRMNTPVMISFSTWVHTIFSCLWTALLFLTWMYTRFWLYMLQKHPYCVKIAYCYKHSLGSVFPQYIIDCR